MVFQQIEQLKKQYTDKYVVVDETRPELRRFQGQTGVVRTVNMSGRALVEFDAYLNIGWYDIELDYLKVVDKPLETDDAPKKAAAPAAAKKPAAKKGAAMSVEEMLAAARANKPAAAAEKKPAAKPASAMSVEEMLAAARANKPAAAGAAAAATGAAAAAATPAPAAPPEPEPAAAAKPAGDIPTTIPEIIAFCRKVDGA